MNEDAEEMEEEMSMGQRSRVHKGVRCYDENTDATSKNFNARTI
jgi:hypothetical protein